ncbi:MAG TPA: sulfatase-like hydrolase/transferase [Planctomycetota bacterium]|nr:sulfatase-like hydrolase/transferase [Planctomycetota bacterium]
MRPSGRGAVLAAVRLLVVVALLVGFVAWWRHQKQPDYRVDARLRLTPDTGAVAPALLALGDEARLAWTVPAGRSLRFSFPVPGEQPVLRFVDGATGAGGTLVVRRLSAGAPAVLEQHAATAGRWTERRVPLSAAPGETVTIELSAPVAAAGDASGAFGVADVVLESTGRGVDETEHPLLAASTLEDLLGRAGEAPLAAPALAGGRRAGLDGPLCVALDRGVPLSVETATLPPRAWLEILLHVANPWPEGLTSTGRVVVSADDKPLAVVPVALPEGEQSVETLTRIDLSAAAGHSLLVSVRCEEAGTLFVGVADLSVHAPQAVQRRLDPEQRAVNVCLILVDALRPDRLGCAGWPGAATPAIDALAARGGRWHRVYGPSSWTLPNLGSVLTGVSPLSHGLGLPSRGVLDTRLPTLAQTAAWSGLTTACFSSSAELSAQTGLDRGYETQLSEALPAEVLVERALDWLVDASQFRWFLTLHFADLAREPWTPSDDALARLPPGGPPDSLVESLRRLDSRPGSAEALAHEVGTLYDAEVGRVDRAIGRLLDGLRARGLLERTLVAVVGTAGEEFYEHNGRQRGQTLFDEVVCVPVILAGPGVRAHDGGPFVEAQPIELVDVTRLLATLGQLSSQAGLQGRLPPPFAPADSDQICHSVLRPYPGTTTRDLDASRVGRWLAVRDNGSGATSLYDLQRDPGALVDLLLQGDAAARQQAEAMQTSFANWQRACVRSAASSPRPVTGAP